MNIMKMGQRVFMQSVRPVVEENKPFIQMGNSTLNHHLIRQMRRPGRGLIFLVSFLTYLLGIFPSLIYALPTNGSVQAGSATINQVSDSRLNISQSSDKSIIDWSSFSIAGGEHVNFQVPSAGSVTLNRVTGNDPSSIFGKLTSNGNLMLINRNGILFGNGAEIDVHGLVATTSDISNTNFKNGQYNFNISPEFSNTITNRGTITASEGGLIAFVAPGVQNTGIISARLGKVSLAAGNTFTLDLYGDQLVNLGVDSQVMQSVTGFNGEQLTSLVSNSGNIFADGGTVAMDVRSAQGLIDNVINMSGYIQAQSITEKNGSIYLTGDSNGLVSVSGAIDATGLGTNETGGVVHILGNRVGLYDNAFIDVSGDAGGGLVLVGGDYQGLGSIPTALENYVGANVSIFADAMTGGNGGITIFWADRRTDFFGTIRSRGGRLFGDGGFAEVSGKEELYFSGRVDTTAANGKSGTLLLDPDYITISGGSGTASASAASSFTTYENILESVASTTNIDMVATSSITLNNSLTFAQTSGQSVTFTATTGNISFTDTSDTIETSGGSIVMSAGGTVSVGAMDTNGGDITLTGTDFTLSGALDAGAGTLTILGGSGETIGLDGTTASTTASTVSTICNGSACGLTLIQSELSDITAGKLVIGDSSSGNIYVDGVTLSHISGGVTLNSSGSNGSVEFGTTASTLKQVTVNAGNGVTVNGDLTIASFATFNPDSDENGTGTFTMASGKALTTEDNASITIEADDVDIAGTISSGTGSTTIAVSDGGTIGLGGTSGDMTITGTELGNITAGTLNIGDSSTGNITVDGISAANSNNATTVNLTTASASSVSFSNNASTFQALDVSSGNGINQSVNLTTSSTATLDADSNDDGSGDFSNTAGTISTGGSALSITGNDFGLSGSINTGAGTTTIIISDGGSLGLGSTSGNMTITGTELGNITAGTLTVGDSTAGAMTINGISSANSTNITTVDLNSSSIAFSTGDSTFNGLTATANTGAITGAVALTVAGTSSFTTSASNQSITLSSTSNDFTSAVSFNTTGSSANATLATNSSIILGASTIGGDQSVTVGGTSQTMNISGAQDVGGTITLQSSGDLTLISSLASSSSSDSAISLTSTAGGIFDGDSDGSTDIEVANGRLVAVSNGGFGTSANPIETTLSSIDLTNSSTGDVNIYELDGIEISSLTQNIDGGDITISYYGSLSGQDLATLPDGSLGITTFTQRQPVSVATRDQTLGGSEKSVGDLSVESTVQLAKTVESDVIQMILQKSGSGNKAVASLDSGGSTSSYVTDIFSDPHVLVDFSSDVKKINPGLSGLENFGGKKTVEEAQVAKLEPALKTESKSSKNFLQKNKSEAKQVLWQKMVRKVAAKKSGKKKAGEKTSKKSLVGENSDTNNNRRNRSNNLTPVSGTRPFERSFIPLQQRSFR